MPHVTRYQPLLDYLSAATEDEIVLTYREIEAMIGKALPESAVLQRGWWVSRSRTPIKDWEALGWRAHADRDQLRVRFSREEQRGGGGAWRRRAAGGSAQEGGEHATAEARDSRTEPGCGSG